MTAFPSFFNKQRDSVAVTMTEITGYHILADLWGCPPTYLEEATSLKQVLHDAAREVGFNIVGESSYQFKPSGATVVLLLESSHISAHSWPELDFIAVDIYSCSGKTKAKRAVDYLVEVLKPSDFKLKEVERFR